MRKRYLRFREAAAISCHAASIVVLSMTSAGAQDAVNIVHNGNDHGAPACMSCHGEKGEGNLDAGYPRLSGLASGYILHEIKSFDDGSRASEIMQPIAKALSDDERQALAAFYTGQTAPKSDGGEPPDAKTLARGKALAENGYWAKGVPGCGQCHGPAGQGVGAAFPALAGQPAAYLSAQLAAWKGKTRKNDPLGLMAGLSAKLTDADVAAVSTYYASLPVPAATKGATR